MKTKNSLVVSQLLLATLLLSLPIRGFTEDSYTSMLRTTGIYQSQLTQQMINYNRMNSPGGGGGGPAPCMPPYELQRGANGIVPPELQGDPRYQAYLRCLKGSSAPVAFPQNAQEPAPVAVQHQPISVSDFVPTMPGHPVAEQAIAGMQIDAQQRQIMQKSVDAVFKAVAKDYRGNNLAAAMAFAYATANGAITGTSATTQQVRDAALSINDAIAQDPNFPRVSAAEKQNTTDSLIFQSAMIIVLQSLGQQDPGAKQQSVELARIVMKRLTGS